jgi:hypothetical protein
MTDITLYKLDAAFTSLRKFDHCSKLDDFLEVFLWHNGEGFDAHLSSHGESLQTTALPLEKSTHD